MCVCGGVETGLSLATSQDGYTVPPDSEVVHLSVPAVGEQQMERNMPFFPVWRLLALLISLVCLSLFSSARAVHPIVQEWPTCGTQTFQVALLAEPIPPSATWGKPLVGSQVHVAWLECPTLFKGVGTDAAFLQQQPHLLHFAPPCLILSCQAPAASKVLSTIWVKPYA